MKILSTTSQIGDIVTQLVGDAVAHSSLIRTGLDPHTYKATQSDLQRFGEARLILYNGLNLEASLERVLTQMPSSIRVASLADAFSASELLVSADGNELDPHIWFDIRLWRKAVAYVADVIGSTAVPLQPVVAARLQEYDRELVALTSELTTQIDQVPPDRRILITAHDAFGYFGRAYGFEVLGVQGLSTATEAGIQTMSRLADVIVARNVPAVFVESTVSPRTIEALQAAVSDRGGRVQVGGELYSDSLGDPNTAASTYVGMMRHNVKTIVAALQGAQ
jgi:manganese/zinc/iron transport system substrate-binding protein